MKRKNHYKVLLLSAFVCFQGITFAQSDAIWESLFNGENFDGWTIIEQPIDVKIVDGSMQIHMTQHTARHSFIRTNKTYKNFIFEVDFKRNLNMDSGILFRSEATPDTAFSALFGYMVKVDPSSTRLWTGGVFLDYGNGITWLHSLEGVSRARHAEKEEGEWNHLRIEAIGEEIKIWLNNIPVVHMLDDKYKKGYIALKAHFLMDNDKSKETLEIAYKNMRIITKKVKKYTQKIELPLIDTRNKIEIIYFR